MLRLALPEYRAPKGVVDRDLKNVTVLGVEIEVNKRITDLKALKDEGFDAVFVSVGTHEAVRSKCEGSDLKGVVDCLDFLRESNIGKKEDLDRETRNGYRRREYSYRCSPYFTAPGCPKGNSCLSKKP